MGLSSSPVTLSALILLLGPAHLSLELRSPLLLSLGQPQAWAGSLPLSVFMVAGPRSSPCLAPPQQLSPPVQTLGCLLPAESSSGILTSILLLVPESSYRPPLQLKTGFGLSALVSECVYVGAHGCVNVPACVCTHVCACRCVSAHVGARGHPPVSFLGSHASCVFETRSLNTLELA